MKVEVVATYKSGRARGEELEFKSDDFCEHMDNLYDKMEKGLVRCIIISVIQEEEKKNDC